MDQDQKAGCFISLVGCAIAVIAVGLGASSWFGAMCMEAYEEIPGIYVGTLVGGIFGFIVFIIGGVKAGADATRNAGNTPDCDGEARHRSSDGTQTRLPEERLCLNCGRQVDDGSKTCKYCGTDVK